MLGNSSGGRTIIISLFHALFNIVKWLFILIASALFLLAGLGLIGHISRMSAAPPYEMIEVEDNRRLHIHCEGPEDAPFVLYDAGAFGIYTDGWWIKENLKIDHRVCLYDRAGMGWSDPVPEGVIPSPDWHVADMRRLRAALGADQPFILVGHSMAGLRLHTYANLHPEDLKGLVFIDAASPQTLSQSRAAQFVGWAKPILNTGIGLARIGIMGGLSYLMPDELDLPKQQTSDKRRSTSAVSHHRATKSEILAMLEIDTDAGWFNGDGASKLPVSVFSNTPGGGRNAATAEAAKTISGFGTITVLPDESHVSLLNQENAAKVSAEVRAILGYTNQSHLEPAQ